MKLKDEELLKINGGEVNASVILGIAGAITFVVGIVDGFLRPYKCR